MAQPAISYPNYTESGLRNFRRWYGNYIATHNTPPPRHLTSAFLEGEVEAGIARGEKATALGMENRRLDLAESATNRELALRERELSSQESAARMSGMVQLAGLGYMARKDLIPVVSKVGGLLKEAGNRVLGTGPGGAAPTGFEPGAATGLAGAGETIGMTAVAPQAAEQLGMTLVEPGTNIAVEGTAAGAASAGMGGTAGLHSATIEGAGLGSTLLPAAIGSTIGRMIPIGKGEKTAMVKGIAGGAIAGGMVGGPPGAVIGGVIGFAQGLVSKVFGK